MIKTLADSVGGEGPFPGSWTTNFSLYPHMAEKGSFYNGINLTNEGSITSYNHFIVG
jgi:hypothetical protein